MIHIDCSYLLMINLSIHYRYIERFSIGDKIPRDNVLTNPYRSKCTTRKILPLFRNNSLHKRAHVS